VINKRIFFINKFIIIINSHYFFNQFQALMIKRFIHSIRNKSLIISQLIIPLVILIINLVYIKYGPIKGGDSPSLNIQISKF
jgi:hypothetical protein